MRTLKEAGLLVTLLAIVMALAFVLAGPVNAHLDDHTCTGTMSTDGTHNLVRVPSAATCTVIATITAQYDVEGTLVISSTGTINGEVNANGGTVTNNGTINGEVNVNGGTVTNNGAINGEVKVTGGGTFTNNGTHNGELKED